MERRIETERLILRPIGVEDAPAVFVWASDPEVNRYMSYPLHRDLSETEAWIASIRPEDLEFGFYRKEDGLLIGTGGVGKGGDGLHHLGYNLRRDVWGMGYAT
ncbi:MAG: GNAT family N-acetyltransferase, partial [Oscillospiraceae bacterium]